MSFLCNVQGGQSVQGIMATTELSTCPGWWHLRYMMLLLIRPLELLLL
jgi:hypothetical protein